MTFIPILLKAISFLPALITGVENIFGSNNGKTKLAQTSETMDMMVQTVNFVASKDIVDAGEFRAGQQDTINGIVRMFNASIWNKNKKTAPTV